MGIYVERQLNEKHRKRQARRRDLSARRRVIVIGDRVFELACRAGYARDTTTSVAGECLVTSAVWTCSKTGTSPGCPTVLTANDVIERFFVELSQGYFLENKSVLLHHQLLSCRPSPTRSRHYTRAKQARQSNSL